MNPHVFIVGCQRSGTTLLQRMVDANPNIAIVHESRFVDSYYRDRQGLTPEGNVTGEIVPLIAEHPRFAKLGVDREGLKSLLPDGRAVHYRDFLSGVYDLHGRALGKEVVGDKTPRYVRSIPELHALWPKARFLHLIRDGRDVCLSALQWRSGGELARRFETWKTDPVATAGVWWDWLVRLGREAGRDLGPDLYREVRYETLVAEPAGECERLCEFLGIPYDGAMIRFHEGKTKDQGGLSAKKAWLPVTAGLRDWRGQMAEKDVERFEAAAGATLERLGYPRVVADPSPRAVEHAFRVRAALAASGGL
ncbi:hypothetical protein GBA63_07395 [Rubrobacter tropicus]|uniref:Sulfotransferase n=1 Tax=Rubrobacter tropicus TaxID=2653851 RepID=A0A6G8Q7S9_9ACTN|nr:sulfotransferase [Rubrobacter tropicus]QIN82488.1 hypothetical protein GBA63_07395 [Rubrobacter tropicus]